ncbi:pyruvate kinase [Butyrivibrio sp. INlla16]|nr:pyruvate kinase [Butyrivibrio sp. INlla16]
MRYGEIHGTDSIVGLENEIKFMVDIFGTLGPSCNDEATLKAMFMAGMTGVRINLSHVMLRDNEELLNFVKRAAESVCIDPKILIDLQGPELRIGNLQKEINLCSGDEIPVRCEGYHGVISDVIPLDKRIFEEMEEGDEILLDDGKILAGVEHRSNNEAILKIIRGGILNSRKSILIKGKTILMPTLTSDDISNISDAVKLGVTGVMQPFVRNRQDIQILRKTLDDAGGDKIEIYAKIENMDGVGMLPDIMDECDEIVIARGDLGNAMPLWELPYVQKRISKECRTRSKRFMVVTQMLASMEHSPIPTRAEVSDIYNAVADGASSVMVTGETAIGEYPVEVIGFLSKTALQYEKSKKI